MGGYNSGRSGGRPTVDASRCITITDLMGRRTGAVRQGWHGSSEWRSGYTGDLTMTLQWSTIIIEDHGWIEMEHPAGRYGETPRMARYSIQIEGVPQPFGGLRWFFSCPITRDLVTKLYLPPGALKFASRKAYRLGYRCQRGTKRDQAIVQAWKARTALGEKPGEHRIGSSLPKPKYRHWRTFDRDLAVLHAREEVTDRYLYLSAMKLGVRFGTPAIKAKLARMALVKAGAPT